MGIHSEQSRNPIFIRANHAVRYSAITAALALVLTLGVGLGCGPGQIIARGNIYAGGSAGGGAVIIPPAPQIYPVTTIIQGIGVGSAASPVPTMGWPIPDPNLPMVNAGIAFGDTTSNRQTPMLFQYQYPPNNYQLSEAHLVLDTQRDNTDTEGIILNGVFSGRPFAGMLRGCSAANDLELYKTDGTPGGTAILKEIGVNHASPTNVAKVGALLYFSANDGINGQELWRSDGTPGGTWMVKDIRVGSGASSPTNITAVGANLFFSADDGVNGRELWFSDGTSAGTVLVTDIRVGGNSNPGNLRDLGGLLVFTADDGVNGVELWKSDGSAGGTVLAANINTAPATGSSITGPVVLGANLYFSANNGTSGAELWKFDGTNATMTEIRAGATGSNPAGFYVHSGQVYFSANDGTNGAELWSTDGTVTSMKANIRAAGASSSPANFATMGANLYFSATNTNGVELYSWNGTVATEVANINPGAANSSPTLLTAVGSTLFFKADNGAVGAELWKSDGTGPGTVLVKDILASGVTSSNATLLTAVGSNLFFIANDGTNGIELWTSDGTGAGTVMVKDLYAGSSNGNPTNLVNLGGTLFFVAPDPTYGIELQKSDGTLAGTSVAVDIFSGVTASAAVSNFVGLGGFTFFQANDGVMGAELWRTDGTAAGTSLFRDIRTGANASTPTGMVAFGGGFVFAANDGTNGNELWKSDGTTGGTVLIASPVAGGINAAGANSNPTGMTVMGANVYFAADDGTNGIELWKSDGTTNALVRNIAAGIASSSPTQLIAAGSNLFFVADDGVNGQELWVSDGTGGGTVLLKDISAGIAPSIITQMTPVGALLFFVTDDGVNGNELWVSDGTPVGTQLVLDIVPGSGSSDPSDLAAFGGLLYFSAYQAGSGRELWKSNGTAIGTSIAVELRAGATSGNPRGMTSYAGSLWFAGDDGSGKGMELIKSDGTPGGTALFVEINPGAGDAYPNTFSVMGAEMYFVATDGTTGRELYKTDGTIGGTVLVKDFYAGDGAPDSAWRVNKPFQLGGTNYLTLDTTASSVGCATSTLVTHDLSSGSTTPEPNMYYISWSLNHYKQGQPNTFDLNIADLLFGTGLQAYDVLNDAGTDDDLWAITGDDSPISSATLVMKGITISTSALSCTPTAPKAFQNWMVHSDGNSIGSPFFSGAVGNPYQSWTQPQGTYGSVEYYFDAVLPAVPVADVTLTTAMLRFSGLRHDSGTQSAIVVNGTGVSETGFNRAAATAEVDTWVDASTAAFDAVLAAIPPPQTITITNANPGVVTQASHGYAVDAPIVFTTTGSVSGLTSGNTYYVRNPTANTYELSATAGGASINTTGSQSGVLTIGPASVSIDLVALLGASAVKALIAQGKLNVALAGGLYGAQASNYSKRRTYGSAVNGPEFEMAGTYISQVCAVPNDPTSPLTQGYTPPVGGTDTTPPSITSLQATSITSTSATILWLTNEPATHQVDYGIAAFSSTTTDPSAPNLVHSVTLTGLQSYKYYIFRAVSEDASANSTTSGSLYFRTLR